MRCPSCGAENLPGLRFCEQCASPLAATPEAAPQKAPAQAPETVPAPPPQPVQVCPSCGAGNLPGLRFCEQCASPLTAIPSVPETVQPEAPTPQRMQLCPTCGAENLPGLRFCEQCASPLAVVPEATPETAPAQAPQAAPVKAPMPPVRRRRRWVLALGALAAAVVVVVIAGILILPPAALAPIGLMTESRAERIAGQVVEDAFPEFVDKPSSVRELVGQSGEPCYIVSYSYLSQVSAEGQTLEIPRILVVEISQDGQDITITESN